MPITGGTELDDWPGGIGQKYVTLRPLAAEMMRIMNFTSEAISQKSFLGIVDDAIGVWRHQNIAVVCFATPEVLRPLKQITEEGTALILLNHQFFLDPFSSAESRQFIESATTAYQLQSLNMKGAGLLPIKGVLKREFPGPFVVARRLEQGGYAELARYDAKPARADLDALFAQDSAERDRAVSFWDRLKRIRDDSGLLHINLFAAFLPPGHAVDEMLHLLRDLVKRCANLRAQSESRGLDWIVTPVDGGFGGAMREGPPGQRCHG